MKTEKSEILIDFIHPHPAKVTNFDKFRWIKNILRDKKNPYLLIGDFNALYRQDKYSREYLMRSFGFYFKENLSDEVDSVMKFEMIDEVLANELVDTYKAKNKEFDFTIPTKNYQPLGQANTGIRIDYIFCSKDFKVLNSGIIKNELTESASDHYPIYAILELK